VENGVAIPRAQSRAGYFFGALNHDGKVFGREGYDEHPEIVLTRKNGDVLLWMLKQFMLLKAQEGGAAIKPEWEQGTRRLAQAFVDTWNKCGEWGNFLNNQTGEVAVYSTTVGASVIGGLALAANYFDEPTFADTARKAAEFYYYRRDVVGLGMTTGGCADILQNADSETAVGLMTALIALYEATGETQWLEMSRVLASLTATWVVSYDFKLPPETELAKLGAKLTGVVWASTQNKHGAPGSCISSCDSLFKIYRATSDRRFADLLRDIAHAIQRLKERVKSNESRDTQAEFRGWSLPSRHCRNVGPKLRAGMIGFRAHSNSREKARLKRDLLASIPKPYAGATGIEACILTDSSVDRA
jgi:hypothetical protein